LKKTPGTPDDRTGLLFPLGDPKPAPAQIARIKHPIWTQNKARLIERYLKYFVFVTKNGAYIDGFAGPQEETDDSELWSASLVLRSEPRWLRKFFLFDLDNDQVRRLEALRDREAPLREKSHRIVVTGGDFNEKLIELLAATPITEKEATFALLDQRSFECHWESAKRLAEYKPAGQPKIELFYFYPQGWDGRALKMQKDEEVLRRWWGRDDFHVIRDGDPGTRHLMFVERFKNELGYKHVAAWPIWEREDGGGRIMYYMIHATDHDEAPKLMSRAYRKAVDPTEPIEQLTLEELLKDES
jgi:three-Cys-motif partner protein